MRIFPPAAARSTFFCILALLLCVTSLTFTHCMSRQDFYEIIEDESVPDVVIRFENSYDIPCETGSVDFGAVQVGTDKVSEFTICNVGGIALHIAEVYLFSGYTDQFALDLSQTILELPPKSFTHFGVAFKPTLVGPISASVMVESDDPNTDRYTFEVAGYGSPVPVPDISVWQDGELVMLDSEGYDYGTVLVGETGSSATFTVQNNGTADLNLYGIDFLSGAVSDYLIDDSALSSTLTPGGSTDFSITFSPTDGGDRSAAVAIQNNDEDENPFTFTLSGRGEPKIPEIYVEVGENEIAEGALGYDFGLVTIGYSSGAVTVTIGNRGSATLSIPYVDSTDPLQFSIDETERADSLPPGDTETTTFSISFEPAGPEGTKTADILITSNDPEYSQFSFQVTGTASPIPVPNIYLKRGPNTILKGSLGHDFGPVEIGQASPPVAFTIENGGEADLLLSSITTASSRFTIEDVPQGSIGPGGSEVFTVTFHSNDIGQFESSISVYSNDPDDNPFTFSVRGEAALPDMRIVKSGTAVENGSANAHDFGSVLEGDTSQPVTFTIENHGTAALSIESTSFVSGDLSDFSYDGSASPSVSPGGSTTFSLVFSPTVTGIRSATFSIENDDPGDNPYTFTVWGQGEPRVPDILLRRDSTNLPSGTSSHDFGTVLLGQSSSVQLTIRNAGTGDLIVSDIYNSAGEFVVTSAPSLPFAVTPGSNRDFTLTFTPALAGLYSETLNITSDDPDSYENPYTITVRGYGETPIPVIDVLHGFTQLPNGSGIYFFGHVQEGDSQTEIFTIENDGTSPLIISGILLTDGYTDQFNVDFSIPPIAPGGSDTFAISFEPTYTGDKWATVTIVNNDPDDDPFTFRVEGVVGFPPVVNIEVREGGLTYPDGSTYDGFGTVQVGSSSGPVMFYIWNNGPDELVIPNIVMTGGDILDFDLDLNSTDLNVPIPPGGFTVFTVTFIPSSEGTRWLDLSINYNDPMQSPYMLRLEGEGDD
jgi:hypothetical protein